MKILLATKNRDKVVEMRAAFAALPIEILSAADMPVCQALYSLCASGWASVAFDRPQDQLFCSLASTFLFLFTRHAKRQKNNRFKDVAEMIH